MLYRNAAGSRPEVLMLLLLLSDSAVETPRRKRPQRSEAHVLSPRLKRDCWVLAIREEWRQAHIPLSKSFSSLQLHV